MEITYTVRTRYESYKAGNNLVDELGCRDLGKACWPLLCEINLSNISITKEITVLAMIVIYYKLWKLSSIKILLG